MSNFSASSDLDIVRRINAGDVEAFDHLFRTYWMPLCTFVFFITRDQDIARDLVADLFAALWERRDNWNISSSIESYLFVSARHRALTDRRDGQRRLELLQSQVQTDEPSWHSQAVGVGEYRMDLRLTLERMVAELPARYQTALYLRWQRDLAYEEIASILETTPAAAKKLVNRATTLLRDRIRDDPRF